MARVYLVGTPKELVGIYTNRKLLLEGLQKRSLTGCVIKGSRKELEVNEASLSAYLMGTGFLKIYKFDEVVYRIWCVNLNSTNKGN